MMDLDGMVGQAPKWLEGSGPTPEIVLSSRVRLARNLAAYPFAQRAKASQLGEIVSEVERAAMANELFEEALVAEIKGLSDIDRRFLLERHLISPEMATQRRDGALIVADGENVSIMINEEDHLRLQSICSGLQLSDAYRAIDGVDDGLEETLQYAFLDKWGYLTACPTNTGTGMRASVLIHLPALVHTKEIDKALRGASQVGLAVRGFYGEGTEVKGNLFQISNQTTLGRSEEDSIEALDRVTRQIIDYEKRQREVLIQSAPHQVEDKIWRAYGILTNARILSSDEVMSISSAVRLGIGLGLINTLPLTVLNELVIFTQPAHLQRYYGAEMEASERDTKRAEFVRESVMGR
jgi:protein arginine kinase